MKLKHLFLIAVLISVSAFMIALHQAKAQSGGAGNVFGWLWGGSTNDADPGCANPNGSVDCGNLGWTSVTSNNSYTGHDPNGPVYGITIPDIDGPVTGLVWNSNAGWIDFDPSGSYPTSGCNPACPTYGVTRVGNALNGWARVQSIQDASASGNSGGWDGWIKMSGIANNGDSYGVVIDPTSGIISGLAWSNELGWLDFNASFQPVPPPTPPPPPPPPPPPTPPTSFGLDVICSGSPNPAYLSTGGNVNWAASIVSPGVPPYAYSWIFTPQPDTQTGSGSAIKASYLIAGEKDANVTVTDDSGITASASCIVNVLKTSKLKEIIPFLPFNYKGSRNA